MKKFIKQRCTNYKEDKHAMLASALSRTKRKITLDQIVIDNGTSNELIMDPNQIAYHTAEHFRNIASEHHQNTTLPRRWAKQYSSRSDIDNSIYNNFMAPRILMNGKESLILYQTIKRLNQRESVIKC